MRRIHKTAAAASCFALLGIGAAQASPARSAAGQPFSSRDSSVTKIKDADRGLVLDLTVSASGYAGVVLQHAAGQALADVSAPSFDFEGPVAAASGGSPRLVVRLSDGGDLEVRPLAWTGDWQTVDSSTSNVDSNGGSCGYQYNVSWAAGQACHAGTTVTDAYVVTDSGWLIHGAYSNLIDNVQLGGTTYGASAKG